MAEIVWVLDHRRDLEADFLAFYHLSPAQSRTTITGPEYLSLAYRVGVYGGVIASRMRNDEEPSGSDVRRVQGDTVSLRNDPALTGLIDF